MRIELPDDIGAALQARAAAQGLSLETWFRKLAERPSVASRYSLSEVIEQCDTQGPLTDEDREWINAPPVGREML